MSNIDSSIFHPDLTKEMRLYIIIQRARDLAELTPIRSGQFPGRTEIPIMLKYLKAVFEGLKIHRKYLEDYPVSREFIEVSFSDMQRVLEEQKE